MAKGNDAGTQAPSAIKAGLKLLGIILYYAPFVYYLTQFYPTNEDGCLVETGSIRCIRKIGLAPSQYRLLLAEDEDEEDPDYPRFLKAGGGGGGGKGKSSSKGEGANAGSGEIGDDEDKYDFGDANEGDARRVGVEPENYTSLYRFWYFYGVVWFTLAGVFDCLNVINGRDLCARKSVCYIGGCLSFLWYIAGGMLIASPGGKVAAGQYIYSYTLEEIKQDSDLYMVESGEFILWFMMAMPFYVLFATFVLCIGAYVKDELKHKERLERKQKKGMAKRANKYRIPSH